MCNENSTTNIPSTEKNKSKKSKVFGFILWYDNPQHMEYLKQMAEDRRCVGICHDKDVKDDGEVKKTHAHVLMCLQNPTTEGGALKYYPNMESNNIYTVDSKRGQGRYLLHLDNPEKIQYREEDLFGNVSLIKKYLRDDDSESRELLHIIQHIEESIDRVNDSDVLRWALEEKYYSAYRRNAYMIARIIDQFNNQRKWEKNRERFIDEL